MLISFSCLVSTGNSANRVEDKAMNPAHIYHADWGTAANKRWRPQAICERDDVRNSSKLRCSDGIAVLHLTNRLAACSDRLARDGKSKSTFPDTVLCTRLQLLPHILPAVPTDGPRSLGY